MGFCTESIILDAPEMGPMFHRACQLHNGVQGTSQGDNSGERKSTVRRKN